MADQVDQVRTDEEPEAERPRPAPTPAVAPSAPGVSPFHILKSGQGVHVRWATAIGAGALAVSLTAFVWDRMQLFAFVEGNFFVRALIPVLVLLATAYFIFWFVGRRPTVVDFMIATEGEMKKVNWSSRKEVWGATKVVIVTVLALAFILFAVDVLFIAFFGAVGVLKLNVLQDLFGPGNQ